MTRAVDYRLYGLRVRCALPLPFPSARRQSPDVRVGPASRPQQSRITRVLRDVRPGWFQARRSAAGVALRWTGLFDFLISADGSDIRYRRLRQATNESFATYLLGQVLSFSLLAKRREPLHATTLVIGDGAVAFLGDSGYGKSTLGAALLQYGFPLLTDDLLALDFRDAEVVAHPGTPRIKLFPRVANGVLGRHDGSRMNPGTRKRILPLDGPAIYPRSVPLRALYVLSDPRRAVRRISIEPLSPSQAMLEIVANTFNTVLVGPDRLTQQFSAASRLASAVPVSRLSYPRDLSRLPAVCDKVLSDLER